MKRSIVVIAIFSVLSSAIWAQSLHAPAPGPEHKKLEYFLGQWVLEGNVKQSPTRTAGKFTGSEHIEWLPGNFFLVIHSSERLPIGEAKALAIMGFDPEEKVYTFHEFNSWGEDVASKGALQGETWTFHSESKSGRNLVKARYS